MGLSSQKYIFQQGLWNYVRQSFMECFDLSNEINSLLLCFCLWDDVLPLSLLQLLPLYFSFLLPFIYLISLFSSSLFCHFITERVWIALQNKRRQPLMAMVANTADTCKLWSALPTFLARALAKLHKLFLNEDEIFCLCREIVGGNNYSNLSEGLEGNKIAEISHCKREAWLENRSQTQIWPTLRKIKI